MDSYVILKGRQNLSPLVWFTTLTGGQLGVNSANLLSLEKNGKEYITVSLKTGGRYKLDPATISHVREVFSAEFRRRSGIL